MPGMGCPRSTIRASRGSVHFDAEKPLPHGSQTTGITLDESNGIVRNTTSLHHRSSSDVVSSLPIAGPPVRKGHPAATVIPLRAGRLTHS